MGNENQQLLNDRIGQFLAGHLKDFVFDELSEDFLKKNGFENILTGVPVPVNKKDLAAISIKNICISMAFIIGCDINFKHRESYINFIVRNYTKDFAKYLVGEGVESASKNDFDYACILFRGAFLIDPDNADAVYCYGRACKDSYEKGGSEDFVGLFKAEALEAFEKVTIMKPEFDMGYYFLGYAYLNLGLYVKASLTFKSFVELTKDSTMKSEVEEWITKLEKPVEIEKAYNLVISGHFQEGIDALLPYSEDEKFNNWWPLWQYMGVAYKELGNLKMAEASFLQVLKLSPSNIDTMKELVEIYKATADQEKVEKYTKKISVVEENESLDKEAAAMIKDGEELPLS